MEYCHLQEDLPYLDMVIAETLRMYPPAFRCVCCPLPHSPETLLNGCLAGCVCEGVIPSSVVLSFASNGSDAWPAFPQADCFSRGTLASPVQASLFHLVAFQDFGHCPLPCSFLHPFSTCLLSIYSVLTLGIQLHVKQLGN